MHDVYDVTECFCVAASFAGDSKRCDKSYIPLGFETCTTFVRKKEQKDTGEHNGNKHCDGRNENFGKHIEMSQERGQRHGKQ